MATNNGSTVTPRWGKQAKPVTPAQVVRAKAAPPGTHPAIIEPYPLAAPGRALLRG